VNELAGELLRSYGAAALAWLKTSGLKSILIVVGALVLMRILFTLIRRIEKLADDGDPNFVSLQEKRAATLSSLLRQITGILIGFIALMMLLREFRIDIAPIIAGAGIIGLAVGFGAQSLVKDVISGFFILLENQFDVGDVIAGAGVSGAVERIGLRFTQLRDLEGRVHFIPNGEFRVVSNLTRGWSRAVIDIGVAYNEDVDRVQNVLKEVAEELRADPGFQHLILEPLEVLGVETFGDSAVTVRLLFKTLPGKQWPVAREFRKRVKHRFDEVGIEIPFPQRVVHTLAPAPDRRRGARGGDSPESADGPGGGGAERTRHPEIDD
jgi:small-conductance mechanosensitive channel